MEKGRAREGEDAVTERKGECLHVEFVQVPICKKERETRETDGEIEDEMKLWSGQRIIKRI